GVEERDRRGTALAVHERAPSGVGAYAARCDEADSRNDDALHAPCPGPVLGPRMAEAARSAPDLSRRYAFRCNRPHPGRYESAPCLRPEYRSRTLPRTRARA